MTNPTTFIWTDPTLNTDGSTITAGEITGYQIGVRLGGVVGTYPILSPVVAASAVTEAISAITPALAFASYFAAVRAIGPNDSAWSAEQAFTLAAPTPSAPTGFSVA